MNDDSPRLRRAFELLAKHHCRAERRGKAWRVFGVGVDFLVVDLCKVTKQDLAPVRGGRDD